MDDFVDRETALDQLWTLIDRASPYRVCLLQGQDGMGKSYLLKEFRAQCNLEGIPCGRVFSARSQDVNYLNIVLNLWEDLNLGKPNEIDKVMIDLTNRSFIPVATLPTQETLDGSQIKAVYGNIVSGEVQGDVIYKNYMQVVIKDHPRARQEIRNTITDMLMKRLAKKSEHRNIILIIDPWETADSDQETGQWLLSNLISWVLDGDLHNTRIIIAGSRCPKISRLPYRVINASLTTLPDEAVRSYWVDKCHLPETQVLSVIEGTSGIPLALCLTATSMMMTKNGNANNGPDVLLSPSSKGITAGSVRCFLEAVDEKFSNLVRSCAISHWFDDGIFHLFMEPSDEASRLFDELTHLRFIERDKFGSFKYSDPVRKYLLAEWFKNRNRVALTEKCKILHGHIQNLRTKNLGRQIWTLDKEEIFLQILIDEQTGIRNLIDHFETAYCSLQYDLAEQYIGLFAELDNFLTDPGKLWLQYFRIRLKIMKEQNSNIDEELAQLLSNCSDPVIKAAVKWIQGKLLVKKSQWSEAYKTYDSCQKLLKGGQSSTYTMLLLLSLGELYQDLASKTGSILSEVITSQKSTGHWLELVQNAPFLAYEWLVHRSVFLPNWYFGTNYQDWIIDCLLIDASHWFLRAIKYARQHMEPAWQFDSQLALANVEQQIGRWSKAHYTYKSLLSMEPVQESLYRKALVQFGIGRIQANEKRTRQAIATLADVLPILEKYQDHANVGHAEASLSQLYQMNNEPEKSIFHTIKSIQAFQRGNDEILATQMACRLKELRGNNPDGDQATSSEITRKKYLSRFPHMLLNWYRRIAGWGTLPATYLFFIMLSFVSGLAITILEGELGLLKQGLSAGTTFRDLMIIASLVLLPIPLTLWAYRCLYSFIGFIVVRFLKRRLAPIEKEQPDYYIVTNDSLNYLGEDRKPQEIQWDGIQGIHSISHGLVNRGISLFSQAILVTKKGNRIIIDGTTSMFHHLTADILNKLKKAGSDIEYSNMKFQIVEVRWLAVSLIASIMIVTNLYLTGSITGEYSTTNIQQGVYIIVGPIALHLLPTFSMLFLTIMIWRNYFFRFNVRKRIGSGVNMLRYWPNWFVMIASTFILLVWLIYLYR